MVPRMASNYGGLEEERETLELVNNLEVPLNEMGCTVESEGKNVREYKDIDPVNCQANSCVSLKVLSDRRNILGSPKQQKTQQSRRLPYWLWYIIAKSLGIKLTPDEKPVFATFLYILTLSSAIGYVATSIWFSVYDIVSERTQVDVLEGSVRVMVVVLWCALGVYSNKLAFRLFGHRKFLAMLRLHSKTVLKLNAALVVFFLWTSFVVLHNLSTLHYWLGTPCTTVSLTRVVCQVHYICQVIFSVFALMWNVLVAVVLVSVCRTHTISIRKFILELEQDSLTFSSNVSECEKEVTSDYTLIDEDYFDELDDDSDGAPCSEHEVSRIKRRIRLYARHASPNVQEERSSAQSEASHTECGTEGGILSNNDILDRYWTIMLKLQVSSLALQRWMVSVLSLAVVWATINMVYWLSHSPQLCEVLTFLAPLLLLPLLCSAYAEVNNEGRQVFKYIRPREQRLLMLQYLVHFPLQLTVFNLSVTYSTISTVALGLLFAVASKIVLKAVT